jgi:hypothetical protein
VHSESADVAVLAPLNLAGVYSGPERDAKSGDVTLKRYGRLQGVSRHGKPDQVTITGLLDDLSTLPSSSVLYEIVEDVEGLSPSAVPPASITAPVESTTSVKSTVASSRSPELVESETKAIISSTTPPPQ